MNNPPYSTPDLVKNVLARSAGSVEGTAGSVTEATILTAIASAEQVIDSRLARLYSVPFDPVPKLIIDIATAFAAMDVDLTFREVRDYQTELNPVLLRHKKAEEMLVRLERGEAILPDYEAPEDPTEPPDNPSDAGSVVGVFNPNLDAAMSCGHYGGCGCGSSFWDEYYGRCY